MKLSRTFTDFKIFYAKINIICFHLLSGSKMLALGSHLASWKAFLEYEGYHEKVKSGKSRNLGCNIMINFNQTLHIAF